MTKQIHDIAVKALNDLKANGVNQSGRARFGSFKEAKRLTQQFATQVRADVVEDDRIPNSTRAAFLFITSYATSLTLRGWADLTRWLDAIEEELARLIEEHKPMTYVKHHTSGRVRIFAEGADDSSNTYTQDSKGGWTVSAMTVGQAKADIANGSACLCNEQGEPLEQAVAPEWVYFVRRGTTGTIRRYDADATGEADAYFKASDGDWHVSVLSVDDAKGCIKNGEAYLCNEFGSALEEPKERTATDPETGISYQVDSHGHILSRRSNDTSWCAAPCTINVIRAVTRLGLLEI
ncbi:MAG: hypothetical protein ACRC8R_11970 [Aeromonas hydrophila]